MENWYQILGVSFEASEDEIKASYRKLAKQYHPDAHPGDQECERRFKEISEAYSILSDSKKRKEYDDKFHRFSQKKTGASVGETGNANMPRGQSVDFQNIHKSFESFFGFDPKTKDIVNEDKLKVKAGNPLDASDIFEKFMGIKR